MDYSFFKSYKIKLVSFVKAVIIFTSLFLSFSQTSAQPTTIRYYSEKNKDTYIGFSAALQVWTRYTDLNPGSTINGKSRDDAFEISIRRYRMEMYGQLSTKTRFALQVGNNDVNFNERTNSPGILDAYVDHQISKAFAFGIGKSGWTGLSRYAAPGTTTALDFDISFMATPFINVNDDLLRKMGVYARGQFKHFDYRVVLSKPYATPSNKQAISERSIIANGQSDYQTSAYVKYQFRDQESQSPFSPATYFGEKDILNIGAGILYQPHSTMSLTGSDTAYHAAKMIAIDLFYETTFNNNTVTVYSAYLKNSLGPKFVRNVGVNNPADAGPSSSCFNGSGNSTPVTGTGNLFNVQLAYLRSAKIGEKRYKLQIYTALEFGQLDALHDRLFIYDVGLNYFIKGHHSKITLGYQNRPIFINSDNRIIESQRKSMVVLQYQMKIG